MATKIRLRRMGSRNKPFYRLVAADSRFATTGRFLENLGWYDPKQKTDNFSVDIERVDYWLGTGAQLSATAKSLVKKARDGQGIVPGSAPEKKTPATPVVEEAVAPVEESTVVEDAPAVEEEPKAEAPAAGEPAVEAAPVADVEEEAPEKQEG